MILLLAAWLLALPVTGALGLWAIWQGVKWIWRRT